MSPKVKPRLERESYARMQRSMAVSQIDPSVGPEPYGLDSKHSYFMDLAFANAASEAQRRTMLPRPCHLQGDT